jgi:hypothetical protein
MILVGFIMEVLTTFAAFTGLIIVSSEALTMSTTVGTG